MVVVVVVVVVVGEAQVLAKYNNSFYRLAELESLQEESASFEMLAPRPNSVTELSSTSVCCKYGKGIVLKVGMVKTVQGVQSGVLVMQPTVSGIWGMLMRDWQSRCGTSHSCERACDIYADSLW